jgi:hypothetical protein
VHVPSVIVICLLCSGHGSEKETRNIASVRGSAKKMGSTHRERELYAWLVANHVPSGQVVVLTALQPADVEHPLLIPFWRRRPQLVLIECFYMCRFDIRILPTHSSLSALFCFHFCTGRRYCQLHLLALRPRHLRHCER